MAGGTKPVDGDTAHNRGQPGVLILNRAFADLLQTQVSFLHGIFGFGQTSQQAISDCD